MTRGARTLTVLAASVFIITAVLMALDTRSADTMPDVVGSASWMAAGAGLLILGLAGGRWWSFLPAVIAAAETIDLYDEFVKFPYGGIEQAWATWAEFLWMLGGWALVPLIVRPRRGKPAEAVLTGVAILALEYASWWMAFVCSAGYESLAAEDEQRQIAAAFVVAAVALIGRAFVAPPPVVEVASEQLSPSKFDQVQG